MNRCYTCFATSEFGSERGVFTPSVKCISGDMVKVVRQFMHPTDDIKETLWLFGATVECFNKHNKRESEMVIRKHTHSRDNINEIDFESV